MNFKEISALLGGPNRINRIIGLKDSTARDVRRQIHKNELRAGWLKKLKDHAREHGQKLLDFANDKEIKTSFNQEHWDKVKAERVKRGAL